MSDLLDKLLGDHERQHRLLERLRSLGTAHPTASGRAVMLNIMQYMRRYPDLNHHPIEDRLFARIGARDGSLAAAAERLTVEHRALERLGERLLGQLRALPVHEESLPGEIARYAELLQAHHDLEETEVFPAARRLLGDEDWAGIAREVEERFADPLAETRADAEFEALYRILETEEA